MSVQLRELGLKLRLQPRFASLALRRAKVHSDLPKPEAEAPRPVDELHNFYSAQVLVAIAVRESGCGGQKTFGFIEADCGCADASQLR